MLCFSEWAMCLRNYYFRYFSLFLLHKPYRINPQGLRQQKYRLHIKRSLTAFYIRDARP